MARNFKVNLSKDGLDKLQKYLRTYAQAVEDRTARYVQALADLGISVAFDAVRGKEDSEYIRFETQFKNENGDFQTVIVGIGEDVWKEWMASDTEVVGTYVNPLLLEEFGSGQFAVNPTNFPIGGRGSWNKNPLHPDWSHGDEDEWTWTTPDGVKHKSSGHEASMPMYNASLAVITTAELLARQIFGRRVNATAE